MSQNISVFYVTCPDLTVARNLSKIFLEEKLCACTNLIPAMESHYLWQGKIDTTQEVVMLIKTFSDKKRALESRLQDLHPYETVCLIELSVEFVHRHYADWLKSSLL